MGVMDKLKDLVGITEEEVGGEELEGILNESPSRGVFDNKTITEKQPIKFEIESASLGGKFTVGEALK